MRLYDFKESGNGYKVRLLLAQLGIACERVEVDILGGGTRTEAFLAMNPNGRIPTLELDDGRHLAESNAILWFLAEGTPFIPDDRFLRAEVLQWMFFEQYSHEPNVATPRFWRHHPEMMRGREAELEGKLAAGRHALAVMDRHLRGRAFFVGGRYSIADVALYAYTHVAPEGGLELGPYPSVIAWLERVREQPGHVPIEQG